MSWSESDAAIAFIARMAALSALVFLQRLDDVRRMLATDLRHAVDLGIRGAPTGNAVTASTHLGLALARGRIPGRSRRLTPCERRYAGEHEGGAEPCGFHLVFSL